MISFDEHTNAIPANENRTDDRLMLAALRTGSEAAFDRIFGLYWDKVYAVCLRHVRSSESAREMTQEIFKSLWERRRDLSVDGPLEHYLHRAAKYQVFNHFRENALRERHASAVEANPLGEAPENAEERLERIQLKTRAANLMDALPAACRKVFRMQQIGRLSQREIAETLNISVKTVEFHLGNARRRLRAALKA